ncbi:hypothetical protein Tco_1561600 [Tanacetum coccineum]
MFEEGDFDAEFDDIDEMVNEAIKNVEGDKVNATTTGVSAASVIPDVPLNVSAAGPFTSIAGDIFEDEMMTIADTLVAIRSTRPRITLVVIRDVEKEPIQTTTISRSQPTISAKDKGKGILQEPEPVKKIKRRDQGEDQIAKDEELARQMKAKERALYKKEQTKRAAQEEAFNAVFREEFNNVQARMDADALLAARLQEEE